MGLNRGPIRLIAADLDGTLLTSRKTITARTHKALVAAAERGVHVVFATARPPRSVRSYYQSLGIRTPQINYNGALIWDEAEQRVLHHAPLEPGPARRVIAFARREFPEVYASVEILDKLYTDKFAENPEYWTETDKHFKPDYIGPLGPVLTQPVTKMMLLGDPVWIEALERMIPEAFGETIAHTRSDPHLLQLMTPGVSKGAALARVARQLQVEPEHILALGDAPNDADMLTFAGTAVVPENAWPQVKPLAAYVVPSNDEEGAAVAIERLVL